MCLGNGCKGVFHVSAVEERLFFENSVCNRMDTELLSPATLQLLLAQMIVELAKS